MAKKLNVVSIRLVQDAPLMSDTPSAIRRMR